ncbi:MAG: sulfotransferase [Pseudomonadales bacterium]|nr:sulfotransferase [Pseudomonadales bacterium]
MKRLHVVGCHRSGTTLIFELLTTCYEHTDHCEHEKTIFNPITCDHGLYIGKKPSDITHIRKIFEADPDLYLIYMRRDPRAVVTSIHPSQGDIYFTSFERWMRYESAAKPLKSHPRFLEVCYEDLVTDPDQVQLQIEETFPFLQRSHKFSEFHQYARTSKPAEISLKGVRPVAADQLRNWEKHLPRIAYQLQRYPRMADIIVNYGYETNWEWLTMLAEVRPLPQGFGEKRPGWWKRVETDLRYYLKSLAYLRRRKQSQNIGQHQ